MPNKHQKYRYSARRQKGSEGLQGEALAFHPVTVDEKKNFLHWFLKKIYDYPRLSETSKLILTFFIEKNQLALKTGQADLLTPDEHILVNRHENPPRKMSPSPAAESLIKRLSELTAVEIKDWKKVGTLLEGGSTYRVTASADLEKISKLGTYVGLTEQAQKTLAFVYMIGTTDEALRTMLLSMGMDRSYHFAELMEACFGGDRAEYIRSLNELYSSGILESPLSKDKKLPAISAYVAKLAQENNATEEMVEKVFGSKRKAEFAPEDFDHIKTMQDKVNAAVQKSLDIPELSKGILIYGPAGAGKTQFASVDFDDIESRFIAEPLENGAPLSAADRLSALLLAIKLAGRRGEDKKRTVRLVFDEFEDVLKQFLNAQLMGDKQQSDYSKLMFNRLLESIRSPIYFLANVDPAMLPDFITTRLILAEMAPPTGSHQISIIERLDDRLPLEINKDTGTKSGLSHDDITLLANSYDASPRVWNTVLAAACSMPNPLRVAKGELHEYAKAQVATRRGNVSIAADYDLRLVNLSIADPFETPLDVYTSKLVEKAKASVERAKEGDDSIGSMRLILDGGPGNGKSKYAKYLASEIGAGVKIVRGSELLGYYISETEDNIRQLFADAARQHCTIIIEEAESIMRSRNYATHSWEISSVNEVNAALDGHNYPVIFTTNLGKDIDPATRDRMQILRFSALTPEQLRIACGKFFGSEVLAGALKGLKDVGLRDLVNLRNAAILVDQPITKDNIREALSRTMRNRVMTAAQM